MQTARVGASATEGAVNALPLRLSLGYLIATFILFLGVGNVERIPNLWNLVLFLGLAWSMLWLGFKLYKPAVATPKFRSNGRLLNVIVSFAGLHYFFYGVVHLQLYGMGSPGQILAGMTDPGGSYLQKFEAAESLRLGAVVSPATQLLTLTSILALPLVPLAIIHWRRLTFWTKAIGIAGLMSYSAFFLAIGTMKGLGDTIAFAVAGFLIVYVQRGPGDTKRRIGSVLAVVASLLAFLIYMSVNQSDRARLVGIEDRFEPSPLISSIVSEEFALGVAVTAFYPTHGYEGLALNLTQDFVWTMGRGSSRALDSYVTQYLDRPSVFASTYPARTEVTTGWPALMNWTTIYPWLASDFTFLGAALLMLPLGWLLAKTWFESVTRKDPVAAVLFAQLVLLIVYIPANNQIGTGRASLIAAAILLVLYTITRPRISMDRSR